MYSYTNIYITQQKLTPPPITQLSIFSREEEASLNSLSCPKLSMAVKAITIIVMVALQ